MNKGFAIDYCKDVNVNGNAQNIRVRAAKEGLPVILFLHGGPGVSDRHNVLRHWRIVIRWYAGISAVRAKAIHRK